MRKFGQNLDVQRQLAKGEIDSAAEKARNKYVTVIGGQEQIYRDKLDEAEQFLNGTNLEPIYLTAEAQETGKTIQELAETVRTKSRETKERFAPIEAYRVAQKAAVDEAQTLNQIRTIVVTVVATMGDM